MTLAWCRSSFLFVFLNGETQRNTKKKDTENSIIAVVSCFWYKPFSQSLPPTLSSPLLLHFVPLRIPQVGISPPFGVFVTFRISR